MHSGSEVGRPSPNRDRWSAMSKRDKRFRAEDVSRAVMDLLGLKPSGVPEFIPRGLGNENWIVRTDDGPLLVKISPPGTSVGKLHSAALGVRLALGAGLPTPRLLGLREKYAPMESGPVRIFRLIDGRCFEEGDGSGFQVVFWEELGAAIRKLHTISLDAFSSRLDGSGPTFTSWVDYVNYRIPQIHERVRASRFLNANRVEPFWEALRGTVDRVSQYAKPTLTHRDLHIDNLLIREQGGLAAILDFDQVEAWDPVADFHKLEWLVFEEFPGSKEPFTTAYGDPEGIFPCFSERLDVVRGLEFVNMIAGSGESELSSVKDLSQRLERVAAAQGWPDPTSL